MSSIKLPQSTLDSLDKTSRAFLWGSTVEKKKQHLVAWKRVCLPKSEGGLGIRTAREMNIALVSKIGWRVLQDRSTLWARVVRSKYKVGDLHDRNWMDKKNTWSSTWRSIGIGLREVVCKGQGWVIGDGRDIKFWTDTWLGRKPLIEEVVADLPEVEKSRSARELWVTGRGWDFTKIAPYVSENKKMELGAVVLDEITGARDRLSWIENQNGIFTVSSAYRLLTREEEEKQNMELFFSRIWKVVVPERIKVFLWLVSQQVIMTNLERKRRHLCEEDVCSVCKGGSESIMHVLRDCPAIEGIWTRIMPRWRRREFFNMSLLGWMYANLEPKKDNTGGDWPIMFALTVWWAWKWRCADVFGSDMRCRDRVKFIKDQTMEVIGANSKTVSSGTSGQRVERNIKWVLPERGWVKVNTDGASRGNPGLATAGGVVRDSDGGWCVGFALNIGRCSAPLAELWGVYYGLYMAWEQRAVRVELEVDSEIVVGFLKTGIGEAHPLSFLVRLCHGFLSRDWIVRISHVYREANRLADGLANYAFSLPFGFHRLNSVPLEFDLIMREDAAGLEHPRLIRM